MSVEYFDERRELVGAIRVIAKHLAAEIGKTALDDQCLGQWPKYDGMSSCRSRLSRMRPLPIGFDKTISQPLMVAVMTDLLELQPDDASPEVRAPGSAISRRCSPKKLAGKVYSVEIIEELAQRAVQRLKREGYANVEVHVGNGYFGWPTTCPVRQGDRDRGPRPYPTSYNQSAQGWRKNGSPGRAA